MQQETLEEAAKKYAILEDAGEGNDDNILMYSYNFIDGAKWQAERMYGEKDMQEYAEFCIICYKKGLPCIIAQDWFKLYKKK